MFEGITKINDDGVFVKTTPNITENINLLNTHLVFEDAEKNLLGEIEEVNPGEIKVRLLGEFVNGSLRGGVIRKPLLNAKVRQVTNEEVPLLLGVENEQSMQLGKSPFYNNYPVNINVNDFFSGHFSILGNSGSGKSWSVARIFQNVFSNQHVQPYKANIFLFDISSEYSAAFRSINTINPNFHYRVFTSREGNLGEDEALRIPIWLLGTEDLALLLQCDNASQIPIIERTLKLVRIFSDQSQDATAFKNHLIAKALMNVLYSNQTATNKRNDIFTVVENCATKEFNLEAPIEGVGYVRKFHECFQIDKQGAFSESVLITKYISSFINNEYDNYEPTGNFFYNLLDLEKALEFTLISDGWFQNPTSYVDAMKIKVRLHSLVTGTNSKIFDYPEYIDLEHYLSSLLIKDGRRYQLININLEDMDDEIASVITKIFTRMILTFSKKIPQRASIPFHILVEEAHRYIKHDSDKDLIGYNIFERVAKEGRKYGVLLGIITQRPVELSDTVISQCSNFIILKTTHPRDIEYIKQMIPNISEEVIDKQKGLQSGTCLGFGTAFKIPTIVKLDPPSPTPNSNNADIIRSWMN